MKREEELTDNLAKVNEKLKEITKGYDNAKATLAIQSKDIEQLNEFCYDFSKNEQILLNRQDVDKAHINELEKENGIIGKQIIQVSNDLLITKKDLKEYEEILEKFIK